jgi:hypothetical protein
MICAAMRPIPPVAEEGEMYVGSYWRKGEAAFELVYVVAVILYYSTRFRS